MPRFVLILLALFIVIASSAVGADLQKGLDAAQRGDYAAALREWRPLAEQEHAPAQYNLGLMYANGLGVVQNYNEAVSWFRKAAEQGNAPAQSNLGIMYSKGQGVLKDYVLGYMWFDIAASKGNNIAKRNLEMAEKIMSLSQVAEALQLATECVKKKYTGCEHAEGTPTK